MSNGAGDVDRTDEVDSGAIVRTTLIADVRGYTSFTQSHGDEEAGRLAARFAELADLFFENPDAVLDALRAQLGPDIVLITNDSSYAAPGMYVTTTSRANESLGPSGRRFLRELGATHPGDVRSTPYVAESAQATEALLEAIEHSDGTRASVTEELLRIPDRRRHPRQLPLRRQRPHEPGVDHDLARHR
jgi:hypothetical protein